MTLHVSDGYFNISSLPNREINNDRLLKLLELNVQCVMHMYDPIYMRIQICQMDFLLLAVIFYLVCYFCFGTCISSHHLMLSARQEGELMLS